MYEILMFQDTMTQFAIAVRDMKLMTYEIGYKDPFYMGEGEKLNE